MLAAICPSRPKGALHDACSARSSCCRNPCNQLDAIDERLLSQVALKADDGSITRKAGVMSVVVVGGVVRAGDAIVLEAPVGVAAQARLEPV